MSIPVTFLHLVKKTLLRDEIGATQACDSQHFEQKQVTLCLLLILSVSRQNEEPRDGGKEVENEVSMQSVACCDHLETVNHVVVLRITVRGEEVLQDLQEEENLGEVQEGVHVLVTSIAEGHNIEVQEHIRDDNDADDKLEERHHIAIIAQNVHMRLFGLILANTSHLLISLRHN